MTTITAILREADIEDFVAMGAPGDEYAFEAAAIAKALAALEASQRKEDAVVTILAAVWAESFVRSASEIEQRLPALRQVAAKIIAAN